MYLIFLFQVNSFVDDKSRLSTKYHPVRRLLLIRVVADTLPTGNWRKTFPNMVVLNYEDNREFEESVVDARKLTVEELRSFAGCEHYSDKEAEAIIESLHRLAILLYTATASQINNPLNLAA